MIVNMVKMTTLYSSNYFTNLNHINLHSNMNERLERKKRMLYENYAEFWVEDKDILHYKEKEKLV